MGQIDAAEKIYQLIETIIKIKSVTLNPPMHNMFIYLNVCYAEVVWWENM